MTDIDVFVDIIRAFLPDVQLNLDAPDPGQPGSTFVTLASEGHRAWIEWRPAQGFGLTVGSPPGYGEGPEEIVETPVAAAHRVVDLVKRGARTIPPREVLLRELRLAKGMSQQQLADLLGIQQGAVSKLERKGDMTISSLREAVAALGGELELRARFDTEDVVLAQFGGEAVRAG